MSRKLKDAVHAETRELMHFRQLIATVTHEAPLEDWGQIAVILDQYPTLKSARDLSARIRAMLADAAATRAS